MGIQGTEVAKENSDIIILDDNFASVVKVSDSTYPFMRGISNLGIFLLELCDSTLSIYISVKLQYWPEIMHICDLSSN